MTHIANIIASQIRVHSSSQISCRKNQRRSVVKSKRRRSRSGRRAKTAKNATWISRRCRLNRPVQPGNVGAEAANVVSAYRMRGFGTGSASSSRWKA